VFYGGIDMTNSGEVDTRWSVKCQSEDGLTVADNLTKQEAIEARKSHSQSSMKKPRPGLTTFHSVRVEHPDLAINKLDIMRVVYELGIRGGASAFMDASSSLLLVDEFFEKYPSVPRTAIQQDKTQEPGILQKLFGGKSG
jgi:hypothetical protein